MKPMDINDPEFWRKQAEAHRDRQLEARGLKPIQSAQPTANAEPLPGETAEATAARQRAVEWRRQQLANRGIVD